MTKNVKAEAAKPLTQDDLAETIFSDVHSIDYNTALQVADAVLKKFNVEVKNG
jgi:hypothetical protein